jgi:histidyl-tRNA synthetase
MKEIKTSTYKGTRILVGNEKRALINRMVDILLGQGFEEISIPIIQFQETFKGKVGEENNNLMFNFQDRAERNLCLAPEYTAVIQKLANEDFKNKKDVKLFYVQECFRGEKPQAGRYRQFTQLGVEILNPTKAWMDWLPDFAGNELMADFPAIINKDVTRGLDYYKEGKGFEIRSENGMQLCGGGEYDGGVGFAIGIDRLLIV